MIEDVVVVIEPAEPEIVVVVEPAAPEIVVVVEPPAPEIVVSVSELGLVGPTGLPGPPGVQGPLGPEGLVGPVGQQGPAGTPGAGSIYLEYGFATPSNTWVINHNLDTYALNVETVDSYGGEIEGNVRFISTNTIEIDWYYLTAGTARLFR